jgi:excisionase family DNA binding protein
MDKLLLTPREAAASLGIGRTTIYDLIARQVIPSVRIGRCVRVPVDALRRWLEKEASGHDDCHGVTSNGS